MQIAAIAIVLVAGAFFVYLSLVRIFRNRNK